MSTEVGPGVGGIHFHVEFCKHRAVFQSQYQRAHKVKVIRCFPHCCPCHVAHRYCGMPLLLVTTLTSAQPLEQVVSLLKIAPADHESWAIGDEIPPQDLRTLEADPDATWYLGQQELRDDSAVGSLFNQSLVDGWTYGWKSGRSQSVRDGLHHATGFVFLVSPSCQWRLVAKVVSPGFTVATYRNRG
ncbi:hypothetical protein ACHHYP_09979, partial [Achlya hypogyna]